MKSKSIVIFIAAALLLAACGTATATPEATAIPTPLFFTLELGWMVLAAWLVVYLHREMTSQT